MARGRALSPRGDVAGGGGTGRDRRRPDVASVGRRTTRQTEGKLLGFHAPSTQHPHPFPLTPASTPPASTATPTSAPTTPSSSSRWAGGWRSTRRRGGSG